MAIPGYHSFMRPLLVFAQNGDEKNIREAFEYVANHMAISEDDRMEMLPSGKQSILANRVHWAKTYLTQALALESTRRSHFRITDRGRALLAASPSQIGNKDLDQFPEFVAFKKRHLKQDASFIDNQLEEKSNSADATPDETIQAAEALFNRTLRYELLERVHSLSPTFFEQLVVDLIVAMGYGGSRGAIAERTQRSADGGIDGIVNQDPLGLDVVYIQAKKYSPENVVGRPAIQQFAGALVGYGAPKGVFMTTSTFSDVARKFAQQVPQKIILIDGVRLTDLMIQYDVGVRVERTISIKRLDLDYFEEIDG